MTENSVLSRFLAILLIISLLFIGIAVVPLNIINSQTTVLDSPSSDKSGSQTSLNLIIQNSIDFRESETFFQYHFLQNTLSRRIGEECSFPLIIVLNIVILSIIFSLFSDENYPLMIFMKISEFQHNKDGML